MPLHSSNLNMAFPLFNTTINNKSKVHKHSSSFQMRKAETTY